MATEDPHNRNFGVVIRNLIRDDCIGLVVLLGKSILFPYSYNPSFTHNWVDLR